MDAGADIIGNTNVIIELDNGWRHGLPLHCCRPAWIAGTLLIDSRKTEVCTQPAGASREEDERVEQ